MLAYWRAYGKNLREVVITMELLNELRTAKGGWTSRQLEILGVAWPPQPGWTTSVVGKHLTLRALRELRSISVRHDR